MVYVPAMIGVPRLGKSRSNFEPDWQNLEPTSFLPKTQYDVTSGSTTTSSVPVRSQRPGLLREIGNDRTYKVHQPDASSPNAETIRTYAEGYPERTPDEVDKVINTLSPSHCHNVIPVCSTSKHHRVYEKMGR